MEAPSSYLAVCECGRSFTNPGGLAFHRRTCAQTKKRARTNLAEIQALYQERKRLRVEAAAANAAAAIAVVAEPSVVGENDVREVAPAPAVPDDLEISVAERRTRRENRRLPKRYRDILPEPPAALPPHPPQPAAVGEQGISPPSSGPHAPSTAESDIVPSIVESTRNVFGLFRRYHSTHFPVHDPEENTTAEALLDVAGPNEQQLSVSDYGPYKNESAYLVGEWFWNQSGRTTQANLDRLVKVIGHPDFRPEDIRGVNWKQINRALTEGAEERSEGEGDDEWEDEHAPGPWRQTAVKISVPFHRRMLRPGPVDYIAGKMWHRNLVDVIRDKIANKTSHPHFHFEPYELQWQPDPAAEPMRVHGELYSSQAFIDAHRELQSSPREPECNLERVVVGLMFASDATQLTSFGDAKLWPMYMAFGNESKYRRGQSSAHAFEHVAYFESVRLFRHWDSSQRN